MDGQLHLGKRRNSVSRRRLMPKVPVGTMNSEYDKSAEALLSETELEKMERLLAHLILDAVDERERMAILRIHGRLTRIYERQSTLRSSEKRLRTLTTQISR